MQELITNRNFQDPAALFEACANPTVSNSLVMLFRCMVCEALLRKQEMDPEFFPLMVSQYDDHSPHR